MPLACRTPTPSAVSRTPQPHHPRCASRRLTKRWGVATRAGRVVDSWTGRRWRGPAPSVGCPASVGGRDPPPNRLTTPAGNSAQPAPSLPLRCRARVGSCGRPSRSQPRPPRAPSAAPPPRASYRGSFCHAAAPALLRPRTRVPPHPRRQSPSPVARPPRPRPRSPSPRLPIPAPPPLPCPRACVPHLPASGPHSPVWLPILAL